MKIIVTGDMACFTNPLYRGINKISYDIPTVTAIEGILKSIFWKPAIRYKINYIKVFNQIKKTVIGVTRFKDFVENQTYCLNDIRTYSTINALQDVKYGIDFKVEVLEEFRNQDPSKHSEANYAKQIRERLTSMKFYQMPYLGLSLFQCNSIQLVDNFEGEETHLSLKGNKQYNNIVYRMTFDDKLDYINWKKSECVNTPSKIECFNPIMIDGMIDIKNYNGDIYVSYQSREIPKTKKPRKKKGVKNV